MSIRNTKIPLIVVISGLLVLSCAAVSTALNPGPASTLTPRPAAPPRLQTDRKPIEEAFDTGVAQSLWDLTNEQVDEDLAEPGELHYTVDLAPDDVVYIVTGWCAQTQSILQQNLEHFTPIIVVDGASLAPGDANVSEWEVRPGEDSDHPEGQQCRAWEVLADNWPAGMHAVTEGWRLDSAINDGDNAFVAGEYLYQYTISVTD